MAYVDTNVIISYTFSGDRDHARAVTLVERVRKHSKLYASPLTLVELYSVLLKKMHMYKLPPEAEALSRVDSKLRYLVTYILNLLDVSIVDDIPQLSTVENVNVFHIFSDAIQLIINKIKLNSLDIIHLAYATRLTRDGIIKYFITFDKEILSERSNIEKVTGIKVIGSSNEIEM